MELPLVYILTLNWNRRDDTLTCLESLEQLTYPNKHLISIDNGSTDGSPEKIAKHFPQVEQLINTSNLGFAGGFNVGLRHALQQDAKFVFIINNDTTIAPDALEYLIAAGQPRDVGALAPIIYYASSPAKIWSAGANRNSITLEIKDNHGRGQVFKQSTEREFLSGCGLLLKRSVLEQVGLFDERFFVYYEDSDYSLRLQKAGYQLLVVPQAKMWHKVSQSSEGSDSPNERYWMGKSSVLFYRKHSRGLQRWAVFLWRAGSAIKTTIRLLWRGKLKATRAYLRGLWHGFGE